MDDILFGPSIFRDEKTLFPEYVPDKLPGRDDDIARLAKNFRSLLSEEGSMAVNIAVVGRAGVGKTALVKYTMERFKEAANKHNFPTRFKYYNCHTTRTKTSILRNLLTEEFHIQSRGFSDEEILEMLAKRLYKQDLRLIVAIDEANMLDSEDILSLIHANEYFGYERSRMSTIVISRPAEWISLLDVPLSGHIHDQLDLGGYDKATLLEILKYRGDMAFKSEYIDEDTMDMISQISEKTQNARHGLEILYRSGKIADNRGERTILPEYIRAAKAEVYPELRRDVFKDLKKHELITALSVAGQLQSTGAPAATIEDAFDRYVLLCEEHKETAKSKGMFRNHIRTLTKVGIVSATVGPVGSGQRGRRTKLTLYDIPAAVLFDRVIQMLS